MGLTYSDLRSLRLRPDGNGLRPCLTMPIEIPFSGHMVVSQLSMPQYRPNERRPEVAHSYPRTRFSTDDGQSAKHPTPRSSPPCVSA